MQITLLKKERKLEISFSFTGAKSTHSTVILDIQMSRMVIVHGGWVNRWTKLPPPPKKLPGKAAPTAGTSSAQEAAGESSTDGQNLLHPRSSRGKQHRWPEPPRPRRPEQHYGGSKSPVSSVQS
ncbi:uncharacterized protein LOC119304061 [Triticum dicoccoides]|uniref:uncharacterized protein LOC119304061 n=1 Tax=Triticum dicoccoides TaxID=85692 RepID=UPI00188E385A|nr:uncharacterized protein LOC119304061 [Triticum dicoccoides]